MQTVAYTMQVRMVSPSGVVTPLVAGTITITEPPVSARGGVMLTRSGADMGWWRKVIIWRKKLPGSQRRRLAAARGSDAAALKALQLSIGDVVQAAIRTSGQPSRRNILKPGFAHASESTDRKIRPPLCRIELTAPVTGL
jgi:hypothetical protein